MTARAGLVDVRQHRLSLTPTILDDAKRFVAEVHRHHGPPVGHRFSFGCKDEDGQLRAVATTGRAVAREVDQRAVLEVTRVASDGCPNACSFLYGAACRIHRVHGFAYAQTYTLVEEPGTSLVAAGWKPVGFTKGRKDGWNVKSRPRDGEKAPKGAKVRWECKCGPGERIDWPFAVEDEEAA
jgi:hypothetical protein